MMDASAFAVVPLAGALATALDPSRGRRLAWLVFAAFAHLALVGAAWAGRLASFTGFDETLAHLVEAGADAFVMPSRFEPSGLNQMYSQRYGTPPIVQYAHAGGSCSVTGGTVYRGAQYPSLQGIYLYGDLCTGEVRSFIPHVHVQETVDDAAVGTVSAPQITSFGQGLAGQIYYTQRTGEVSQLGETTG